MEAAEANYVALRDDGEVGVARVSFETGDDEGGGGGDGEDGVARRGRVSFEIGPPGVRLSRRGAMFNMFHSASVDRAVASMDLLGSALFVAGSVLFYPALEHSCAAACPCQRVAAALFVVGSALFWAGAVVGLRRLAAAGWASSAAAHRADALLCFGADGAFTVGSVFFFPSVAARVTDLAGVWLFTLGSVAFAAPPLRTLAGAWARELEHSRGARGVARERFRADGGVRVCALAVAGCLWFLVGSVLFFPAVAQGSRAVGTLAVHCFVAGSCCFTAGSWLHWGHLPPPKPQ
jgi:hypothetical protein